MNVDKRCNQNENLLKEKILFYEFWPRKYSNKLSSIFAKKISLT